MDDDHLVKQITWNAYDYNLFKDTYHVVSTADRGEMRREEKGRGIQEKGRNQW